MRYRRRLLGLSALLLLAALGSCGKKEQILDLVGEQKITLAEFEEIYRPLPGLADSGAIQNQKVKALDQLIEKKLLMLAALERQADKDTQLLDRFQEMKNNILLGQLYKIEIADKAKPTESEIRNYYKRMGTEIKAGHILVKTEAEAKDIWTKIKGGADFGKMAHQYSQDPGSAANGGSLGWFGWGRMVDEFQRAAFALKPGQISQPVETAFGYHIIKVDSVRNVEREPLDKMRERITQQLAATKPRELTTRYLRDLRKQAGMKIQEAVLDQIAAKQKPLEPGAMPSLPELTPEEMKMVLVKYSGGSWTVAYFFDQARRLMHGMVDLSNRTMLEKQIEALLANEFLLKRARARGLDRQPVVKAQIKRAWEDLLAGWYYREQVTPKLNVEDSEAQQYYRQNKKEFYQEPRVLVRLIVVRTKEEAEEVYGLLSRGADFAALAKERSIDWTKASGGALVVNSPQDPNYPEVAPKAFSLPLGQLSQPFACRDGYAVVKVDRRELGLQRTFEQCHQEIISRLRQNKEEAAFQELIADLKTKFTVTIDQALLAEAGGEKGSK